MKDRLVGPQYLRDLSVVSHNMVFPILGFTFGVSPLHVLF
jgi:hypothetical protein